MDVVVVGAGVVGLTTALRLADDGHRVRVLGDRPPEQTTSAVAAALWYPYLAAPAHRTRAWGAVTYRVLSDLARAAPEAGVDVRWGREVLPGPTPPPDWADDVDGFTAIDDAWTFRSPVADMGLYLPWLLGQLHDRGVVVEQATVAAATLAEVAVGSDALVLCVGLGARDLLGDDDVVPVRGQVVLVEQPGLREWLLATSGPGDDLTYVVPRRSSVVCGGTAGAGGWDTQPDAATAEAILARCRTMVPQLAGARVLSHRVGLRPARPTVRVEVEHPAGLPVPVVHCYGHGGAGVTLSWGCADEVVDLVGALV